MSQIAPADGREQRERRSVAIELPARGTSRSPAMRFSRPSWVTVILACVVALQCLLLLIALVPANEWTALGQSPDGPIPPKVSFLVAGFFYVAPAVIGALCRRWQMAVALATLPAFFDLAIFAVAVASHYGPFYLAQDQHVPFTVGTLELFAVLGALGWLGRTALLLALADRNQSRAADTRTDTK